MSAAIQQAVLRADLKPPAVKLMALVVAFHFNDEKGRAWAGLGTMARECGMSERHAKRALAMLKCMGVLVVLRTTGGGDRYATTTHYGFDLQALARLSTPVRGRTGGAGALGADEIAGRDSDLDDGGLPSAPAAPDPVRRRPAPSAPAAPKRDERKPKASLSSKAPATPDSAGGRSVDAGNTSTTAKVVQMAAVRKQPALDEATRLRNLASAVAENPMVWAKDDAAMSSVGVRLGMDALATVLLRGGSRVDYMRQLIELRAQAQRELKAAKRRSGPAPGPASRAAP